MSKPTLVQSLLNRPSQTYGTQSHQRKEYHSAKQEMLRIAAAQSDPSLSEYFTPNSSPRTSMAATSRKPSRRSLTDAAAAVPSTRTPSRSSAQRAIYTLSTSSSLSSTSLDGHSIFSDYLTAAGSIDETTDYHNRRSDDEDRKKQAPKPKSSTTTTNITTTTTIVPVSTYGMGSAKSTITPNPLSKGSNVSTPTKRASIKLPDIKASSSTEPGSSHQSKPSSKEPERHAKIAPRQPNGNPHRPFNAFAPLPESTSSPVKQSPNRSPGVSPSRQQTANTPSSVSSPSKQSHPNGITPKFTQKPHPKVSSVTNGHAHRELPSPQLKPPSSQTISSYHNRRQNTSKIQNSIMMNMSALLEEDEDGGDTTSKRPALRHTTERGRERKRSQAPVSLASSSSSESGSVTPGLGTKNPPLHRRRSRSLDSISSKATARLPPQTLSTEVQALTLASHGDLPSIGTQGYTSLVLPRAPMPLSDRPTGGGGRFGPFSFGLSNLNWNKLSLGTDGKVDLTQSGFAQTTMASVEVVRGLSSRGAMFGRSGSWKVLGALGRRASSNSRSSGAHSVAGGSSDDSTVTPKAVEETILGFTSYRAPPSYVSSRSVLVQVWAVGVDGVDGRLVGVRFGSASARGKTEGHKDDEANGHESVEEDDNEDGRDNPVTKSTANSPSKNPFTALGRSLSLSLKRQKKEPVEEQQPQLGRSLSLKPNKKLDPNSVSISALGNTNVSPVTHTKHHSNVNATPSKSGSAPSTPEKKRSGTQLQHQRSKHQELSSSSFPVTPPKLPSHPQKLKAKTKAVPVPGVQIHVTTQQHSSPTTSSAAKDKHVAGTPPWKDRQLTPSTSDQNNPPPSAPMKSGKSKSKSRILPRMPSQPPTPKPAEVGFIPGRSFVGRVLEVGWELGDEVIRKGEWVVGLVDVRKCGALAEFIVVDQHRIHRVPHPQRAVPMDNPNAPPSPVWVGSPSTSSPLSNPTALGEDSKNRRDGRRDSSQHATSSQDDARNAKSTQPSSTSTLTLEEMALLPLCGIPAYRAVRSFIYAFSSDGKPTTSERYHHLRRALVLRGHDGAGAMAAQMLIQRGWRVSVHVPFSCVPADATQELADGFMRIVEDRAREWGADEVIFDDGEAADGDDGRAAAVRVIETLREEGDIFDVVLDTVGGKEVREAGERLLKSNGSPPADGSVSVSSLSPTTTPIKRRGVGLFTTLVGDTPERPIPSAADAFRANLRSFRFGAESGNGKANGTNVGSDIEGMVGYAWVSVAHEVSEWEGADVRETLRAVLALAMEDGIRPLVEDVGGGLGRPRVVPFEKTPGVFVNNGPLSDGGTLVVRIAG